MNKLTLALVIMLAFTNAAFAQSDFGFHIISKGSEWTMLTPSATDVAELMSEGSSVKKDMLEKFIDNPNNYRNNATLSEGEVVFVVNKIDNFYYCYSISGRMMAVKGNLTKVEPSQNSGIGYLNEDITLISGKTIKCDFVWIIGQDLAKQTVTIQIGSNEKYEIPQAKCELLNPILVKTAMENKMQKVD